MFGLIQWIWGVNARHNQRAIPHKYRLQIHQIWSSIPHERMAGLIQYRNPHIYCFQWQFFLSNKFLKALMSATHSFIVWSVARALWSSVVIFQNPLFLSSPVDPLSFQLFIPSHSNMADGQNPAHSSPIQLHTHTPPSPEWMKAAGVARLTLATGAGVVRVV